MLLDPSGELDVSCLAIGLRACISSAYGETQAPLQTAPRPSSAQHSMCRGGCAWTELSQFLWSSRLGIRVARPRWSLGALLTAAVPFVEPVAPERSCCPQEFLRDPEQHQHGCFDWRGCLDG